MAPEKQDRTGNDDPSERDTEKFRDLAEKIGQAPKEELEEAKRRENEKKDRERGERT